LLSTDKPSEKNSTDIFHLYTELCPNITFDVE
jgi:hypothetical protein